MTTPSKLLYHEVKRATSQVCLQAFFRRFSCSNCLDSLYKPIERKINNFSNVQGYPVFLPKTLQSIKQIKPDNWSKIGLCLMATRQR